MLEGTDWQPNNRILATLSRREALRMGGLLEPVELPAGRLIFGPGDWIETLIFPETAAVSLLVPADPGDRISAGLIGREGLVGLPALMGGSRAELHALVQAPGLAWRASANAIRPLMQANFAFRTAVMRHAAERLICVTALAACNAVHPLKERTALLLLTMLDRCGPGLSVTQEVLADMLGARRPTVNAVLQELKAAALLRTARGRIAIADPDGLEHAACGCRARLRAALAALQPFA